MKIALLTFTLCLVVHVLARATKTDTGTSNSSKSVTQAARFFSVYSEREETEREVWVKMQEPQQENGSAGTASTTAAPTTTIATSLGSAPSTSPSTASELEDDHFNDYDFDKLEAFFDQHPFFSHTPTHSPSSTPSPSTDFDNLDEFFGQHPFFSSTPSPSASSESRPTFHATNGTRGPGLPGSDKKTIGIAVLLSGIGMVLVGMLISVVALNVLIRHLMCQRREKKMKREVADRTKTLWSQNFGTLRSQEETDVCV